MWKHVSSDSELEETPENASSEEPDASVDVPEYEKQRLTRIAENRARMAALGLPCMASSFMGQTPKLKKHKDKRKMVNDEEYKPDGNDDDDDNDFDDGDDDEFDDEDFVGTGGSGSSKRKVKNKGSRSKKKVQAQKPLSNSGYVNNDDELMQAIALSLKDSAEVSGPVCTEPSLCSDTYVTNSMLNERKGNSNFQEDTGRKKKKKSQLTRREEMTEDEVVVRFCQFDEAGKGCITLQDVRRMAMAHDFTWTDKEMADMIHCFDSEGHGKLSLSDFHNIVGRCNMSKGSENP